MTVGVPVNSCLVGAEPLDALKVWNMIIRPPRAWYDVKAFGPYSFHLDGVHVTREDIQLRTARGVRLECSHYRPEAEPGKDPEPTPVVIYLHGNASSRLEALQVIRPLLVKRIAVFCYDSAGCGLSEGEYVSLGWYERDDLACVIEHVRRSPFCTAVGLWGRSMGAATALLHCDRDPKVDAICADSAFASLPDLMRDIAQGDYAVANIPAWMSQGVLAVVRMRVKALADFDTEDVVPLDHVRNCKIPALFVHAKRDRFIPIDHTHRLYAEYAGDKEILELAQGQHNTQRGRVVVEHVVDFFERAFRHDTPVLQPPARLPFGELTNLPQQKACHGGKLLKRAFRRDCNTSPEPLWQEVVRSPGSWSSSGPSPHADRTPSCFPRTPPPLPQAPPVEEDGEVSTPPAVDILGLEREGCEALGQRRGCKNSGTSGSRGSRRRRQSHDEDDVENRNPWPEVVVDCDKFLDNQSFQEPHKGALERAVAVAGREDVFPALSTAMMNARSERYGSDLQAPSGLENRHCCSHQGNPCCGGKITGSIFGFCGNFCLDVVEESKPGDKERWQIIAI